MIRYAIRCQRFATCQRVDAADTDYAAYYAMPRHLSFADYRCRRYASARSACRSFDVMSARR